MAIPILAKLGKKASDVIIHGGKGSRVLKTANGVTDALSTGLVTLTPPMPSPDMKNMKTILQQKKIAGDWLGKVTGKPVLDKGSVDRATTASAIRMRRRIQHPLKSAGRILDRTIPGAVASMPMLNFGISPQLTAYAGVNPLKDVLGNYSTTQLKNMAVTHGKGMLDAAKYGTKEVLSGRAFQPSTPHLYNFMKSPQMYLTGV